MARKVDEEKLVRIKQATMKTIVECGIEKTTIAMIARMQKKPKATRHDNVCRP